MISITVSANESDFDTTCVVSTEYGKALKYKLQCSPPALGTYVRFTLIGENVTLVLCHVVVRTLGKSKNKWLPPRETSVSLPETFLIQHFLVTFLKRDVTNTNKRGSH